MTVPKQLEPYNGPLSSSEIAAGMNAATRNAERLAKDGRLLFDNERYASSAALTILSIEESGKARILRELALARNERELRECWREYRTHTKKNLLWPIVETFLKGARRADDFRPLLESDAEHPYILDKVKQISIYTDCYNKGHWSVPEQIVDKELTQSLLAAHLRKLLAIVSCWLLLASWCLGAQKDDADLKALYDSHRWFELRDAVVKGAAPIFYRGIVACVFDRLDVCKKDLDIVFSSAPKSDQAVEGHRTLGSAYRRHGKYRDALAQVDALLAVRPKDSDAAGDRPLLEELGNSPDQEIALRHTMVPLQDALPFSINGVKAAYWPDTGAELSVMTESEAKRFGLKPRDTQTKIGDVNGTLFKTRIAIADEMSIGDVRLKHVAFLVLSDEQPPFNEIGPGSRGLIGIPVLLALRRFSWSADNRFEVEPKSKDKSVPHADFCFDGNHPVVQVQYQGRTLMFPLDTGATKTDLYPPFAAAFPELIRSAPKTNAYKMEGNGGAKYMEAVTLRPLHFSIGGFPVVLKSAAVLLKPTTGASKLFAGNLGIEFLQEAHTTTFDFKAMTLTLQ